MTASPQTRNYLYGKGELFFRAVGSEGYDHLGNAPAFTISLTEEKLEHFILTALSATTLYIRHISDLYAFFLMP